MALCCHNKPVLLLKGRKVETNSTDMIYGHMIIPRNTKFEITTVRNTWYHYYEDRHYLRSFVQWPMKGATRDGMSNHVTKLTQLFHGERLMNGSAVTATEIKIKQERKIKSVPKLGK